MARRAVKAGVLGAMVSMLLAQRAEAVCPVQPLPRLVRASDDVWWGTVVDASAAPSGEGTWSLTVRLDDVLKGQGAVGDTVTVDTGTCGLYLTPAAAERAARTFIGDQQLFLVTADHRQRLRAYSELIRVSGRINATAAEQYAAAVDILGLTPNAVPAPITGHPTDDVHTQGLSETGFVLVLAVAILLGPLIAIAVILRRRTT